MIDVPVTDRGRECIGKDAARPKLKCRTPREAQDHLEYIARTYGTAEHLMSVYSCPHAAKGDRHWHVGRINGEQTRFRGNPPNRRGRRR